MPMSTFAIRRQGRTAAAQAVLFAAVLALSGCASSGSGGDAAAAGAGDQFPVTVEHKYGSTTIPAAPERVVSVGLTDHDTVLALGVTPIAVTPWFGDQPNGVWPWAQDELGDAQPVVFDWGHNREINFEEVAAVKPDLILGVNSGLTQPDYERLSQIAPTVAQSGEHADYGTPWQAQTRTIGSALGRSDSAEQRIAEVEAKFAAAREANPEFAGAIAVLSSIGDSATYYPLGPHDARVQILSALGFEPKPQIAELAGDEVFTTISAERLDLLNADVLVWTADKPVQAEIDALRNNPLYQKQPVVQEGRDIFLPSTDPELDAALAYNNVLSLPLVIDRIVPLLQKAIDGKPTT